MNVAIVYDRVTKWGGAERVLLALHRIWPKAPLYTAVYDPHNAKWARVFKVRPSFLQKIPFANKAHELLPWATPVAFESFDLDGYDVVLSVTSSDAKYVLTKPDTLHVCYCLTPTRYLWSGYLEYQEHPGLGAASGIARYVHKRMTPRLRDWDLVASSRPDYYIAISERVRDRIRTYYGRDPLKVIYPPVNTQVFAKKTHPPAFEGEYFLTVSRLVGYKRIDIIIQAFNELGWQLVIIGAGRDARRLRSLAGRNILFLKNVPDRELASWYQHCRAFVYAADEDFGIAPVEALSAGKPIVAYKNSAVAEMIQDGETGELFSRQTVFDLVNALKRAKSRWYDSSLCTARAREFSEARFRGEMKDVVTGLYNKL